MASITKRVTRAGKISYRVQIRIDGHPPIYETFSRKSDAKQWAEAKEADIRRGKHFPEKAHLKRTAGEMIDRYISDVLPRKPRSEKTQKQQLEWWKSEIGSIKLVDIKPAIIVEKRDKLLKPPVQARKSTLTQVKNGRSPATANRYLAALSHAFSVCKREWNWTDHNPVSDVSKLKEPPGRTRYLQPAELDALLEACSKSAEQSLYAIVVLAITTALRKGNIIGMKWDWVDLERERIIVPRTKNDNPQRVPIVGPAVSVLRKCYAERDGVSEYVFPGPRSGGPITIQKRFVEALNQANIRNFKFHDLRHCAGSYLAMNGATERELMEALGHKSTAMAQRYSHLSDSHNKEVFERMIGSVFGDTNVKS